MRRVTELGACEFRKLMDIYAEGNRENAEYFYPELPLTEGVAKEEKKFAEMLRKSFLTRPENELYVWEAEGQWVAALRLTKLEGFYYLEALETKPDRRKRGYGKALLEALCRELAVRGPL